MIFLKQGCCLTSMNLSHKTGNEQQNYFCDKLQVVRNIDEIWIGWKFIINGLESFIVILCGFFNLWMKSLNVTIQWEAIEV